MEDENRKISRTDLQVFFAKEDFTREIEDLFTSDAKTFLKEIRINNLKRMQGKIGSGVVNLYEDLYLPQWWHSHEVLVWLCNIARDKKTPWSVLRAMASPNEDIINELVAENPSTPPDALEALASATMFGDNIDHISIYNSVITNPNTSLKTLRKLSNQGDEKAKRVLEVRLSNGENKISKHEDPFNRNTSTKEAPLIKSGLEKLVDDKDLSEEERVALDREAIDLDIQSGRELYDRIKRMYRSPVSDGRVKVAAYSFTPKIFLRKLSQDKENYVREQVAKNPNTPVDILETLSKDEDTWVSKAAQRHLSNLD